jgi:ACR3 family arsenite efflux pump ArsB
MDPFEKYQSVIILGSVIMGLLLGQIPFVGEYAEFLIVPFLVIMLCGIFLQIPFNQLKNSFKNLRFAGISLAINFIFNPLLAYTLGYVFLQGSPALWIGFIMLMVTPCTDWYLVFTGLSKGNIVLSTSILPMNLILQLILLPVYLFLFAGTITTLNISFLIESILIILLVPFMISVVLKWVSGKFIGEYWLEENIYPKLDHVQLTFLNLAIISMFASQGEYLVQNPYVLVQLLIPILIFFVIVFIFGQTVGRFIGFNYQDTASLNLTTLARNSPIALAIALTAFPEQPLIALALVIGPLIELPVLGLVSQILLFIRNKGITDVSE